MGLNFGITVQCPVFRILESVVEKVRITRVAVGKEGQNKGRMQN